MENNKDSDTIKDRLKEEICWSVNRIKKFANAISGDGPVPSVNDDVDSLCGYIIYDAEKIQEIIEGYHEGSFLTVKITKKIIDNLAASPRILRDIEIENRTALTYTDLGLPIGTSGKEYLAKYNEKITSELKKNGIQYLAERGIETTEDLEKYLSEYWGKPYVDMILNGPVIYKP